MTTRPILFSAPMVRALLDGTKTQTRRVAGLEVINQEPDRYEFKGMTSGPGVPHFAFHDKKSGAQVLVKSKLGSVGDQLWVREAWRVDSSLNKMNAAEIAAVSNIPGIWIQYEAGASVQLREPGRYRQGRFMPRWASRITLEITGVRVERLQNISEADALAEGIDRLYYQSQKSWRDYSLDDEWAAISPMLDSPIASYKTLWESLNGAGSWNLNPWVWVIEFKKVKP